MTIDERLEKLAVRHEALTQSVELLSHEVTGISKGVTAMQGFIREVAESTARLLHIAEIHEHRINKLEEGS